MRSAVTVLLLLAGAGSIVDDEATERRFAVRIGTDADGRTVARHLFSSREWLPGFSRKEGTLLLLRIREGKAAGAERLVPSFLGRGGRLETCHVYTAYVVPEGKHARERWDSRINRCMKDVCEFWERELLGLVEFRAFKPEAIWSKRKEGEYRASQRGFLGQVVADAEHRAPMPRVRQRGLWPVLVVFVEGQKKGGGGCAASLRGDHGVAVISEEVLPFLYLETEEHPEKVEDPIRGGMVSWDWGLAAVAHELGHTIGLPHPDPGDGSIMSGAWLRGLGQTSFGERQRRLMLEPAVNAGYLTRWQVAGPFEGHALKGPPPKTARWKEVATDGPFVDLARVFHGREEAHAFARVWIRSEAIRDVTFFAGSDDTIRLWMNGKGLHSSWKMRGWVLDQDKLSARLDRGWNELVLACGNGSGGWGFSLRVVVEDAKEKLRVRAKPPR
ncbi:MAG: hypothetical protein ACYS99_11695 [Planctomycetota bacterium]|jgi:hypothetical protein